MSDVWAEIDKISLKIEWTAKLDCHKEMADPNLVNKIYRRDVPHNIVFHVSMKSSFHCLFVFRHLKNKISTVNYRLKALQQRGKAPILRSVVLCWTPTKWQNGRFNFTSQLFASLYRSVLLLQTRASCVSTNLHSSWIKLTVSQHSHSSFFGKKEGYTFRGPFVRLALKSLMEKRRLYLTGNFELFTALSGELISKGIPILGIDLLILITDDKERTNSSCNPFTTSQWLHSHVTCKNFI